MKEQQRKVREYTQYMTECFSLCVHVDATAQWRDRLLKERVKIATLIKGSWVPLRLHGLLHPSSPSLFLNLPLSQWIYYLGLPLSAGLLNGPQLLNFMPRVNLVALMVATKLHWRGTLFFFYLHLSPRKKAQKWIWNSNSVPELHCGVWGTCILKWAEPQGATF